MADGSNGVTATRRAALHEEGYLAASRGLELWPKVGDGMNR